MLRLWTRFQTHMVRDEEGAGIVEYVLLIALIAILIIAAALFLKDQLAAKFTEIGNTVSSPGT